MPTEQKLMEAGVFKGGDALRQFAECKEFWERQPYGTRFYFNGNNYLHHDVLRTAIEILDFPALPAAPPASMARQESDGLIEAIIKAMGITRTDVVVPGRGEAEKFETGPTMIKFTRPGVAGEFTLMYTLTHQPPFVPVSKRGMQS